MELVSKPALLDAKIVPAQLVLNASNNITSSNRTEHAPSVPTLPPVCFAHLLIPPNASLVIVKDSTLAVMQLANPALHTAKPVLRLKYAQTYTINTLSATSCLRYLISATTSQLVTQAAVTVQLITLKSVRPAKAAFTSPATSSASHARVSV